MSRLRLFLILLCAVLATSLAGCKKVTGNAYALTATGRIVSFATSKPADIKTNEQIVGLPLDTATGQASESIVQIAYRSSDQQIYGVSSANHIYQINPQTGQATLEGSGNAFSSDTLADPQISFDTATGNLRMVSSDQNLLVDVASAALISSGTRVFYASGDPNAQRTPALTGIAYSFDHSPTLYALDASTQSLITVGNRGGSPISPDQGVLYTVGSLGVSFGSNGGFDITRNGAYAALSNPGTGSSLFSINLSSGQASLLGVIGKGDMAVISLAVVPAG